MPESPRDVGPTSDRLVLALFTVTIFLAAALLFLVQPMVAKMVLPRLGGSPEVWSTSMVFFQLSLLGGYLYAHLSVGALGPVRQAALHSALLVLALPITLPSWTQPATGTESLWLVGLLATAVGAPFVALATASPLLQRWFAGAGHPLADDPYFLYAASNAGSLLGLLSYPFLLEPFLPLAGQARVWAVGYGAFSTMSAGCAYLAMRGVRARDPPRAPPCASRSSTWPRARRRRSGSGCSGPPVPSFLRPCCWARPTT